MRYISRLYSCMCNAQLECDSAFELWEESHPLFGHQYVSVLIYRKCVCVCLRVLQGIRLQSRSIRCREGSETEAGSRWWLHPNNDCTDTVFTSAEIEQQSIFPHLTAPCPTKRHMHNCTRARTQTSLKHSVHSFIHSNWYFHSAMTHSID